MKDPVDHISRPALPWRNNVEAQTECGLNAAKVPTLSRDAYKNRLKDLGRQRAAMLTCMTCSTTSERHGTWESDPRMALAREIEWECSWRRAERDTKLRDELDAIAVLIDHHRQEFDDLLAVKDRQRQWDKQRKAFQAKKATKNLTPGKPL